jgi:hypothetical protein
MDSFSGFYAAEAGLNVRADAVRQLFQGSGLPSGSSPDDSAGAVPCVNGNDGSGDYACTDYAFRDRQVITYVEEAINNGTPIVVPRGEDYQNLHGVEYHYVVYSRAISPAGFPEAILEMHFKSRVLPLFQFAAFYNKDLEILPSADWLLDGPVHSNGDLYLGCDNTLDITGQVTVAGDLYRGRKDVDGCMSGPVRVNDPAVLAEIPTCSGTRQAIAQADVVSWDGMINTEVSGLTVPPRSVLEPVAGGRYWDSADLRIVLDLTGGIPAIEVRNADGTVNGGDTSIITGCGVATHSATLYNHREGGTIDMLDIDVRGLLDCMHGNSLGATLDDATDGGLVWYLGVDGASAAGVNRYGVRVSNAGELSSTDVSAPLVRGLTLATEQAMYVQGDYNAVNKIPAAMLADSLNVLSNNWSDAASTLSLANRGATTTTINTAFLAGTDTTGGAEGSGGQDLGGYNGGLENFMRLHEDWTGVTLVYRGALASLYEPRHVSGAWVSGAPYYAAPIADWGFDYDLFEDPALTPPLSPRFIYLKQELFVRHFEL